MSRPRDLQTASAGPTNWNRSRSLIREPPRPGEDVDNVLTLSNPLNVAQSDPYKERAIRRACWDRMMGAAA